MALLVGADVCAREGGIMMRRLLALWVVGLFSACGEPDMGKFKPGVADACRILPPFIAKTGLGQQVALDSQQRGYQGIRLVQAKTGKTWQHPSWDDAGHVGAFARDRDGYIYVAPTPDVSLKDNPPALQNRIYRVDAQSGEMSLWLELPAAAAPSAANPFGVMGLFYDCDTHSLYASSLAGSAPRQALGRIYQIDIASKQLLGQLEDTDAIGIGVFNGVKHKRLYLGAARSSDVYSVALDAKGGFTPDVRHEFALAALPDGNTTSVRKFNFGQERGQYVMRLKETEFGFRLMAENNPHKRTYGFKYDAMQDRWEFMDTQSEMGE